MQVPSTALTIRLRYLVGLSAIALLITASFITMQRVVSEQRGFSSLVNLAGHQAGLVNRISFFSSLMVAATDDQEYETARSQVGRSINKMKEAHRVLRHGSAEDGIPYVHNDNLRTIYEDRMVGLDLALARFWERAEAVYGAPQTTLTASSPDYLYLVTYGPHALEPILDAAVDEYQEISKKAIIRIEKLETLIWLATLVTLLLEAVFIFRPLESRIRNTIGSLQRSVAELTSTRSRLQEAQELASVGDWQLCLQSGTLTWSDEIYRICGINKENASLQWKTVLQSVHIDDQSLIRSILPRLRQQHMALEMKYRILRPDGEERLVYQQARADRDETGKVIRITGTIQDITAHRELSTRLEKLSENIPGFMYQFHLSGSGRTRLSYVSKGVSDVVGLFPEELLQDYRALAQVLTNTDLRTLKRKLITSCRELSTWQHQWCIEHPGKGQVWVEGHATPQRLADGSTCWYGYVWDITERKRSEDQIRQLALFDPLTGLANRRMLKERLRQATANSARTGNLGAVLLLDLDNFKTLNDTRGHNAGDALLVEVGTRLEHCVRETDTIARLGGDEFVVVLEQLGKQKTTAQKQAMGVAEKIRRELSREYVLGKTGHVHHASASIGVVVFSGRGCGDGELLKRADVAMFEAKDLGRNKACYYSKARQRKINHQTAMAHDLKTGINNNEFAIYYQPQISAAGRVAGAEALIRWFPAQRAPISPGIFIPVAEETGMIITIGDWVLETVCHSIQELEQLPLPHDFSVAVNISAKQLASDGFLSRVQKIMMQTGVSAKRLKFELTETCLVEDLEYTRLLLAELRRLGIRVELDDFGTGYSSLNSLKKLPLDTLKLDSSLVHEIEGDRRDQAIVQAAIAMAKSLSLEVVAEGVETEQQRKFLLKAGCDRLQGYLLARPMPYNKFVEYLRQPSVCCDGSFHPLLQVTKPSPRMYKKGKVYAFS